MRDYVWLLLVALACVNAQYYYPQPSPPFGLPDVNPPPSPSVAPVVEEITTRPPPPTTTALPPPPPPTTTAPPPPPPTTTAPPPPPPTTTAPPPPPPTTTTPPPPPPTTTAPPPPPPTTTTPPPPPPTTTAPPPPPSTAAPPPNLEYLPPPATLPPPPPPTTTVLPPPPPTTTVPPPPPPTTTVPPPPPPTTTLPPPPPPTTTLPPPPPPTTTLPPPPPPSTTTAPPPPPLEYLPPVTARPVPPVTTENPLFPDANENQQVSILFPTAAPEPVVVITTPRPTTLPPPPPVVVVTTPRPTTIPPPPVQPVLTESEEEIAFWDFRESIPGDPEIDYPIFDKIPATSFTCDDKIDGYYADIETRCQVFHVCTAIPNESSIKNSFLCPNGTLFNQENFACQWWPDVECATSPDFFALNENIGKVPESSVKNQQVVIAAPAQAVVAIQNPVVPLSAIQPAIQAQAVAASSTATASIAAAQAVQVSYQAEPAIDAPVLIALEPVKAVAVPEPAAAVILPAAVEIPVPVEISAPVVLSIADAPIQLTVSQEAVKQAELAVPSGLYQAPVAAASSSGAQNKY